MDCSLPGSSAHGISRARILDWVAISFSRGSSQPRDWARTSCTASGLLHCRQILYPLSHQRSSWKRGMRFSIQCKWWASLVAQLVKNLPATQDTLVPFWVRKLSWRRDRLPTSIFGGFPDGWGGKESACNVGNLGLIPGLGRFPGGGHATLIFLPVESQWTAGYSPWGGKESDRTEWLSTAQTAHANNSRSTIAYQALGTLWLFLPRSSFILKISFGLEIFNRFHFQYKNLNYQRVKRKHWKILS